MPFCLYGDKITPKGLGVIPMKKVLVFAVVVATAGAVGRTAPAETATASLSELFKPGAPVVCEGHWGSGTRAVFDSDRILIKHGNDSEPPKVKTEGAA